MKWIVYVPLVLSVLVLLFFRRRTRPRRVFSQNDPVVYNLRRNAAPRINGWLLKVLAWLISKGVGRAVVLPKILRDSGFGVLDTILVHRAPTFHPLIVPPPEARGEAAMSLGRSSLEDHLLAQLLEATPDRGPFNSVCIADIHGLYKAKRASPTEVVERVLRAFSEVEGELRPLCARNDARALSEAAASSARWKAGKPRGILDGIPFVVKDEVHAKGYVTLAGTSGTCLSHTRPAVSDATVVARLVAAGAILVGKTTMYEIGAAPSSINIHCGTARNPFNPLHSCGGSSAGSGSSIALGLVPISVGEDTGGSVRIPAGFNGAVGLKSTHGRVSMYGGDGNEDGPSSAYTMATYGVLGATVADAALAYVTVGGLDVHDSTTLLQPPVHLNCLTMAPTTMKGLRVGVYEPYFNDCSSSVRSACWEAVNFLKSEGAREVSIEIPLLEEMRVAHSLQIISEFSGYMNHALTSQSTDLLSTLQPDVQILLAAGSFVTAAQYQQAAKVKTLAVEIFQRLFESVDVIVMPTTAISAPRILDGDLSFGVSDVTTVSHLMRFVFLANFVGTPALSVPVGYSPESSVPFGMQIMGPWWSEDLLLRVGQVVEGRFRKDLPCPQRVKNVLVP